MLRRDASCCLLLVTGFKANQIQVQLSEDVASIYENYSQLSSSFLETPEIITKPGQNYGCEHNQSLNFIHLFAFYLHRYQTDSSEMSDDKALDSMFDAMMAAAGPSQGKKKEVTYAEFQAMLDSTPLFMRETPKDGAAEGEGNDVLEALKSLVFEGEGDGESGTRAQDARVACRPGRLGTAA
jgi:hypothetical protein